MLRITFNTDNTVQKTGFEAAYFMGTWTKRFKIIFDTKIG